MKKFVFIFLFIICSIQLLQAQTQSNERLTRVVYYYEKTDTCKIKLVVSPDDCVTVFPDYNSGCFSKSDWEILLSNRKEFKLEEITEILSKFDFIATCIEGDTRSWITIYMEKYDTFSTTIEKIIM